MSSDFIFSRILKFNIFTLFRHLNSLFTVNVKAIFKHFDFEALLFQTFANNNDKNVFFHDVMYYYTLMYSFSLFNLPIINQHVYLHNIF